MRLDSILSEEQLEKENISSHSNHQQQQLAPQDPADKMRQLQDEILRAESTTKECRQAFDRAFDDVNIALENRNIAVQNLQMAKEECERSERAYHEKGVVLRDENTKLHILKKQMEQCEHLIKMKSDPAVTNDYDIIGILGSGGFGHVLECRRKEDKKIFAMKSVPIEDPNIFAEMDALKKLRHPNIVHFETFLADGKKMCHLILDYAIGGNVQTLIETRQNLRLSEELCAFLSADLAKGLKYIFRKGYYHCDLKPANLLLTGSLLARFLRDNPDNLSHNPHDLSSENDQIVNGDFRLQIGDFGLATQRISQNRVCGTKHFMAPEVDVSAL
jgi:serine/threonine protein kinase